MGFVRGTVNITFGKMVFKIVEENIRKSFSIIVSGDGLKNCQVSDVNNCKMWYSM